MALFARMGMRAEKSSKQVDISRGAKVICGRWVDISKDDIARPDYRAWLVGKEFHTGIVPTQYAATPPLEALDMLLAHVLIGRLRSCYPT